MTEISLTVNAPVDMSSDTVGIIIYRNNPANGLQQVWDNVNSIWETYDGLEYANYFVDGGSEFNHVVVTMPPGALSDTFVVFIVWRWAEDNIKAVTNPVLASYSRIYNADLQAMVLPAAAINEAQITSMVETGVQNSQIAIGAAVWEATTTSPNVNSTLERLTRVPNAVAGGIGGLPTVNASNQVAGVAGVDLVLLSDNVGFILDDTDDTIPSLLAAQTTLINDVPTNAELAARTLIAAAYGTASAQTAILADVATRASQVSVDARTLPSASYGTAANQITMLTNQGVLNVTLDAVKADTAATVGRHPSAGAKMAGEGANAKNLDQVEGGGGVTIPVNQVVVPASRTWLLKETEDGLHSEVDRTIKVGESKVFAVDFREDLPTNGRLKDVDSIAIGEGTSGGVTFAASATDPGVDKTQAKVSITAVTIGDYEINFDVNYQAGSGSGTSTGVVTLIVVE